MRGVCSMSTYAEKCKTAFRARKRRCVKRRGTSPCKHRPRGVSPFIAALTAEETFAAAGARARLAANGELVELSCADGVMFTSQHSGYTTVDLTVAIAIATSLSLDDARNMASVADNIADGYRRHHDGLYRVRPPQWATRMFFTEDHTRVVLPPRIQFLRQHVTDTSQSHGPSFGVKGSGDDLTAALNEAALELTRGSGPPVALATVPLEVCCPFLRRGKLSVWDANRLPKSISRLRLRQSRAFSQLHLTARCCCPRRLPTRSLKV